MNDNSSTDMLKLIFENSRKVPLRYVIQVAIVLEENNAEAIKYARRFCLASLWFFVSILNVGFMVLIKP